MYQERQETDRIRGVYADRDASGKGSLYTWYRPEVRQRRAALERTLASLLVDTVGTDLSRTSILDVGCGAGGLLRLFAEWGARPERLVGTELLEDRLAVAAERSPPGITWHLGDLGSLAVGEFELVCASTVFSSILKSENRTRLAESMWKRVSAGGWILIFDFRYNNPSNGNVGKVSKRELHGWFPAMRTEYKSLVLAPPISRIVTPVSYLLGEILSSLMPFFRSHFIFMAQKSEPIRKKLGI